MTIAELLKAHAANLTPANGDRAYTRYHGETWEGTLELTGEPSKRAIGKVHFDASKHGWRPHREPVIFVGYDEAITFDAERGMWYAPADAD